MGELRRKKIEGMETAKRDIIIYRIMEMAKGIG